MLLFALPLGLALHVVSEDPPCTAGIRFASGTVLRLGVALLGRRLTIAHVTAVGWQTVVALLCAVVLTIGLSLLPTYPHLKRDTALTLVGVTTLSTAAMVLYPCWRTGWV